MNVAVPSKVLCNNQIGCFSRAFSLLFFCFESWTSMVRFWVYVRPKAELLCAHFSGQLQDSSTLESNFGSKLNEVSHFEEVEFRQERHYHPPPRFPLKKNLNNNHKHTKPKDMFCQQTSFSKCSHNLHSLLPHSEASGFEPLIFARSLQ